MRGYRKFFFRGGPTLTNFSVLVDEERGDANTLKAGNHGPASETPFKVNNFSFISGRRKTSSTFEDTTTISFETTDRCVVSLSKTLYLLSIVLLNSNMTEKMMLVT